jgi:N-formylglutamate amidohydrolase
VDAVGENRKRLEELHRERALALMTPLADEPAYMADLDSEITATEAAFVAAVVIEIASMRAELSGRQWG